MFDNLKKSIAYALAVNIAELAPVIIFVIFQIPVPLSTILMLVICIGTDMVPAVSLAYENAELDIMQRMPRSSKMDHLVNGKLIVFSYMINGTIESFAGMFTYFYVFNDYGFRFTTTIFLNSEIGWYPDPSDMYDPYAPNFGNSNWGNFDFYNVITWGLRIDNAVDARLFYTRMNRLSWTKCRWDPKDESIPSFWRISQITGKQICHTPEALMYAQSAYFMSVVVT